MIEDLAQSVARLPCRDVGNRHLPDSLFIVFDGESHGGIRLQLREDFPSGFNFIRTLHERRLGDEVIWHAALLSVHAIAV